MLAVPMLALAGTWWLAASLIVLERAGKAIRNPPRDVMLSRAGEHVGQGWAFGLHEALDQTGALAGPLAAALILFLHHNYRAALAWMAVPSAITLVLLFAVRVRYRDAGHIVPPAAQTVSPVRFSRAFWLYAISAALAAFGFADFTLISFHFGKAAVVGQTFIPVFYAAAMGAAGAGSLAFGRWFDLSGLIVVVPGMLIGALVAPLSFLGGFGLALAGTIGWGIALGVHEAVMSAAVAKMVPVEARGRAYGLFMAMFGLSWFLGSALMGALYDISIPLLVAVSVAAELLGVVPLIMAVRAAK
jgi:MFS-type transporter involved in bile tolerance (Atg22 family)